MQKMTESDFKIKTCPHCNGAASLRASYSNYTGSYFVCVKCEVCGATGKTVASQEPPRSEESASRAFSQAIEAWNLRAYES